VDNDKQQQFKGALIHIDVAGKRFKRDSDNSWHGLPTPKYVAIIQVPMRQSGGARVARISHTYKAFCVYLKAGTLNILAYRGSLDEVREEAQRLADFLGLQVKDLLPRNAEGIIEDDDSQSIPLLWIGVLVIVFLVVLLSI
jgi:hypothetical protein